MDIRFQNEKCLQSSFIMALIPPELLIGTTLIKCTTLLVGSTNAIHCFLCLCAGDCCGDGCVYRR